MLPDRHRRTTHSAATCDANLKPMPDEPIRALSTQTRQTPTNPEVTPVRLLSTGKTNRGETQVGTALTHFPGVAFANLHVSSHNRTREIDWLIVTPNAVATIEVKGTRLVGELITDANQPWTIGGQKADFAGGPNPVSQTRVAAATTRGHLNVTNTAHDHYVNAITVVTGDVVVTPHQVADTWVCTPDQLAGVLLRLRPVPVNARTAAAICASFGYDIDDTALESDGFEVDPAPVTKTSDSSNNRREKRRATMQATADMLWQRSHARRVALSGIGAGLSLIYLVTRPWESVLAGIALMTAIAIAQLLVRARIPGPRKHGVFAVFVWLVTLIPYVGVGAALTTPLFTYGYGVPGYLVLDVILSLLVALLLLLTTFSGRCGFIYPPPVVVERFDAKQRPTGLFLLAQPEGKKLRFDLHLLDPSDPRAKTLNG